MLLASAECPVVDSGGVRGGADDPIVAATERLHAAEEFMYVTGTILSMFNDLSVFQHASTSPRVGHIGHRAAGFEIGQDHFLARSGRISALSAMK